MKTNNSSEDLISSHFILKGFTSVLIGAYIFIAAYLMKAILDGFLIDDHTLGMLSAEIIEVLLIAITFLVLLFSTLTLYFSGRINAKKAQQKLWNAESKDTFRKYLIGFVLVFCVLIVLMTQGFINYITPVFLILYGVLLFLLREKARKDLMVLIALCILLGMLCFLIPTYWDAALSIIGIVHITYGLVVKK
jgi:hypothetical protein